MVRFIVALLACGLLGTSVASATEKEAPSYTLPPMVVESGPGAKAQLRKRVPQSVQVLSAQELKEMPGATVMDVLAQIPELDLRQRGAAGIQSDISLRGGLFEETLIMLDGIRLQNPQTGHHNLDLPISKADIARIEIIKGPGSRAYGAHAAAGIVHIITRRPQQTQAALAAKGGSFDYGRIHGSAEHWQNNWGQRLSLNHSTSSGHISDQPTDFDASSLYYQGLLETKRGQWRWQLLSGSKDFGAYKFYSAKYPQQREETEQLVAAVSGQHQVGAWQLDSRLSWQRHRDDFRMPRIQYRNRHQSQQWQGQLHLQRQLATGTLVWGGNWQREKLDSPSLGNHQRTRSGLFVDYTFQPGKRWQINLGHSAVYVSNWHWQQLPSAAVSFQITPNWSLFTAAGQAYRVPSYTELHYEDPANEGNSQLDATRSTLWEAGLRWHPRQLTHKASLVGFYRQSDDAIDWRRHHDQQPWQVGNFDSRTQGLECNWRWLPGQPWLNQLRLGYTYLDTDISGGASQSKYLRSSLRHKAGLNLQHSWGALTTTIAPTWQQRRNGDSAWLLDGKISYHPSQSWELYAEGKNLLDEDIVLAGFAPIPGAQIYVGARWRWQR